MRSTAKLQSNGVSFISLGAGRGQPAQPWSKALIVKDPDGHAVMLVQR